MKKQLIMDKALELFAKQGFEATSVQQITEHCGISKGAFYLSFKSKDELIIALIDHFMMQFTTEIDYIVRNTEIEKLLYDFYYATFHSFHQHSDFAKILMKEQSQTFNEEFIVKMHYFDRLIENIILSMIERLYGEEVKQTKYDLMYCIKGFMNTYSQLFLFYNVPLDLNLLSESLVEKTNLLARHTHVPFISEDLIQVIKQPMCEEGSKEQILEILEQKIEEIEEPIEKESLILLKQQLREPTLSPAIVKGLLENIRNHPLCKWISYLLQNYFEV
ncbi:TetR/AcrR family transcriptional regulator [Mesobacillus zeae]|uniref:TetR/AcrR family transcriptional regulator n=1 Tax=Mesobacillus zeae TaxID=1917180 RepID=A0A398B9R0_9BACI|nr:TetR/AcrR family transcriptional regulator [Mesobacillus zeae]RID86715.1 TetR/AcrR family transcriptional regulator [Mesobacillus zeae]